MFLGTHTPKLDDKGRVILPARFRQELEGGLVLTRGQERCIYVFSVREFERASEYCSPSEPVAEILGR